MNHDEFVFNGIDGSTGRYLMDPLSAHELYIRLISDKDQKEELDTQSPELKQRVRRQSEGHFGPPSDTDPQNLAEVGWGVIFAHDAPQELYDALKELLDYRRSQAGDLYKEFRGHLGYRAGDSKENHRVFLARQNMTFGPVDPKRVPYYLLIVGDPESIPFQFQYMLDVEYAVGRIYFPKLEEYVQYAHSVVEAERRPLLRRRRVVLAGTQHEDDSATIASATLLLPDLAKELREGTSSKGWAIELQPPQQATKDNLLNLMGGAETPALLFTATHGLAFPNEPKLQNRAQGALACQEWEGPVHWRGGAVPAKYYIAADDIGSAARFWGSIFFHFACFGAGTPRYDDFAHARKLNYRETVSERAFVAPLPRRLLGHPSGGPLAIIGHVDRAWTASFRQVLQGVNVGAFRDALRPLMRGSRVGFALEAMNIRYAEIATALTSETEDIKFGKSPDEDDMARLWVAHNDARSYIIVGDPAVRLNYADDAEEPPATLDSALNVTLSPPSVNITALPEPGPPTDEPAIDSGLPVASQAADEAFGSSVPQHPVTATPGHSTAAKLLFVHGTGVRETSFNETLEEIGHGIAQHLPHSSIKVDGCLWGARHGALLDDRSAVLPPEEGSFSATPEALSDAEQEVALWEVLLTDPLFELRSLAEEAERHAELRPGLLKSLSQALAQAADNERVARALEDAGVSALYAPSVDAITGAPAIEAALRAPGYPTSTLGAIVVRAVVADLCVRVWRLNAPTALRYDAERRRTLVDELGRAIEPEGAFGAPGLGYRLLSHGLTWYLRRRSRAERTGEAYPFLADIALYQRDGEPIRSYIIQRLAETGASVILAHSLGGVACVDLLARFPQPQVKLLITVGSQAPFLYQIDALWSVRRGEKLPAHFPRWINFYDPLDYLAYLGGRMFQGELVSPLRVTRSPAGPKGSVN